MVAILAIPEARALMAIPVMMATMALLAMPDRVCRAVRAVIRGPHPEI